MHLKLARLRRYEFVVKRPNTMKGKNPGRATQAKDHGTKNAGRVTQAKDHGIKNPGRVDPGTQEKAGEGGRMKDTKEETEPQPRGEEKTELMNICIFKFLFYIICCCLHYALLFHVFSMGLSILMPFKGFQWGV